MLMLRLTRFLDQRILLILILFANTVEGILDWEVFKKITQYGQEVVLFCGVENCCSESAGWTKHVNDYYSEAIFLNIQNLKYNNTRKFDGRLGNNGFFLFIRNFSFDDTQFAYSCSYGLNSSKPKKLRVSLFLEDSQSNKVMTTDTNTQNGPPLATKNDNISTYVAIIAVLSTSLAFVVLCFIIAIIILWKKIKTARHKRPTTDERELETLNSDQIEGRDSKCSSYRHSDRTSNRSSRVSIETYNTQEREDDSAATATTVRAIHVDIKL